MAAGREGTGGGGRLSRPPIRTATAVPTAMSGGCGSAIDPEFETAGSARRRSTITRGEGTRDQRRATRAARSAPRDQRRACDARCRSTIHLRLRLTLRADLLAALSIK